MGILPPDSVREIEQGIMVAVRDRIDGWWNPAGATQRLQSGPWSHRKDFLGVKNKPFSRGHVSVCLDLAGVVIDRMTMKGKSLKRRLGKASDSERLRLKGCGGL